MSWTHRTNMHLCFRPVCIYRGTRVTLYKVFITFSHGYTIDSDITLFFLSVKTYYYYFFFG
jgi:hypothetical protein